MRMSSGPARMNENPRPASSSWKEDTPKSKRIPAYPFSVCSLQISEKFARTNRKRPGNSLFNSPARASADGSRSTAVTRQSALSRTARECPPPPKVQSRYSNPSLGDKISTASFSITG